MVKSAKVVAFNTDLDSAQAFISSRENMHLMVVVSSSGDDIFTQTRQAVLDLQEDFFESDESISKRFATLGDAILDRLASAEQISLLLAAFKGEIAGESEGSSGILYLQGVGNGAAYLHRQGKTLSLVTLEQEGRLISGYLQKEDRVLLLSDSLYALLNADSASLDNILNTPIDQFEEAVNLLVNERHETAPLAAILIHYDVTEKALATDLPSSHPNAISNLEDKFHLPHPKFRLPAKTLLTQALNRVKQNVPANNRGRLFIGIALISIILLVVLISSHLRAGKQKQAELSADIASAKQQLNTAEGLKGLDMVSATAALNQAKADVSQALKIDPKNSEALNLQTQITGAHNDILKIYLVNSWPVFLDLGLIKDGFFASNLELDSGQMLLLDQRGKTLVSVDVSQKSNQVLAGSAQLGQAQIAALSSGIALVYSTDKGVMQVDTQSLKSSQVIKSDTDWGKIAGISLFSSNIYLLDEFKNQIWKYVPAASGYSNKQAYLKDDVKADLAGATKMLIDSSIWVLKPGNEIDKFTSGEVDSFNLSGLDQDLKEVKSFYVSSDTNNVYILDSGNSRVVVVGKDGKYVSQYIGDKFKTATDIAVDEQNKKLYVLDSNTIYQVDLH